MCHSFPEFAHAFHGLGKNSEGEHAMNIPRRISPIGAILFPAHRNHQPLRFTRTSHAFSWLAAALFTVLLTGFWLSPALHAAGSGGSSAPGFRRQVIVDYQHITGEPSLPIASQDRNHDLCPFGSSTTGIS